jgi:hypothetical protein
MRHRLRIERVGFRIGVAGRLLRRGSDTAVLIPHELTTRGRIWTSADQ